MCKDCTCRASSGGGEVPQTPEDPRMFPNKEPQGTFSGDSEDCVSAPLELCRAAAQTGLRAPGICLIPADLLMLQCSWGVYL